MKFQAEFEFIGAERAVVTLVDERGDWAGSQRVDLTPSTTLALFDACLSVARQNAAIKGGEVAHVSWWKL